MLRCGQMMNARDLVKFYIYSPDSDLVDLNDSDKQVYQSIRLNFNNVVKEPFSIHQIMMHRSDIQIHAIGLVEISLSKLYGE
ncbi:hypothetical protein GJ496_000364 [Pomphorhynchus laevis]|nr:hypothetical protein GJ496_000364 [Pomphorhynchus laevis]